MPAYLLHQDPDMIEVLEKDLTEKITASLATAQMDMGVHGVFSLDDLEAMTVADLCSKMALGVAYAGAEDVTPAAPTTNSNAAGKDTFSFLVVLAVPVTRPGSDNRLDGSKTLSILRQTLRGKPVANAGPVPPRWYFVKELPQPSESDKTVLYYSQVWRLTLPSATQKP